MDVASTNGPRSVSFLIIQLKPVGAPIVDVCRQFDRAGQFDGNIRKICGLQKGANRVRLVEHDCTAVVARLQRSFDGCRVVAGPASNLTNGGVAGTGKGCRKQYSSDHGSGVKRRVMSGQRLGKSLYLFSSTIAVVT